MPMISGRMEIFFVEMIHYQNIAKKNVVISFVHLLICQKEIIPVDTGNGCFSLCLFRVLVPGTKSNP